MATQWMKCKVYKSIFSNERVIELEDRDFVVPADKVKGEPDGSGQVEVKVFSRPDGTWAEIPTSNNIAIPVKDPDLLIKENNMSKLFYINEEERGIGKSYALAKFCIGLSLLNNSKFLVVTAPSFIQSKIVLKYISDILKENQIFHEVKAQVDSMSVVFKKQMTILAIPINQALAYTNVDIVLDEHQMIPHEIMAMLEVSHSPIQDIRQHNLFELLNPVAIG